MKSTNKNTSLKPFEICLFLLVSIGLHSCHKKHEKQEIETAMLRYDQLIQKMDADSIALLYAPDGDLGDIAHGRDSIRKFLSTFTNVRVLSTSSTSDSIVFSSDTAVQTGKYTQVAVIQGKDTARLKGSYTAKWVWLPAEGWRLKKMITLPNN